VIFGAWVLRVRNAVIIVIPVLVVRDTVAVVVITAVLVLIV
tara:strand:- start:463 stop:585 length:123 start_codon:yes stop_codon:yes gene_type:complete